MLFTDTDSLTYVIKSENIYEELFKWKDLFDFSNYSSLLMGLIKKLFGKMKYESGGIIVIEFVG